MLVLYDFQHLGDIRLRVRLAQPHVEADIQVRIVFLEVLDRHAHDLLPHGAVAALALLKKIRRIVRLFSKFCVDLRAGARLGVDFFKLGDRKRRFFRIFAREIGVKVAELGVLRLHLRDD